MSLFKKNDDHIIDELTRIHRKLNYLIRESKYQRTVGGALMALIDDLVTKVEAQTTVVTSVEELLVHLSQMIADAGTDPVKLQAVIDTVDANTARLTAAVTANTPTV